MIQFFMSWGFETVVRPQLDCSFAQLFIFEDLCEMGIGRIQKNALVGLWLCENS